jgi:hypothetical protein
MEILDLVGEIEHHFGDVRAGLKVTPTLEFKQISFSANDWPRLETLQKTVRRHCSSLTVRWRAASWAQ